MIFYAIRHKATGQLMPASKRRGYSNWNPATEAGKNPLFALHYPRLLKTRKEANNCIIGWANFPNGNNHFSTDWESGIKEESGVRFKDDGRTKDDLEVVKIELHIRR